MWLVYGGYYLNKLNLASAIPLIMADLSFSPAQVGLFSSAFFALYCFSQLLWGYLSDVLGPRRVITIGGAISVIGNLIFSLSGQLWPMTAAQALNGFGQGAGWGPSVKLLNNWFPPTERARALGIYCTCISVFVIIAYNLTAVIGKSWGWSAAFQVMPAILSATLLLFWKLVRDYPDPNPGRPDVVVPAKSIQKPDQPNRFIAVLKHRNLRFASLGFLCYTYISYTNLVWLPNYFMTHFNLSLPQAGLWASFYPAFGLLARPFGGYISDVSLHGRRRPLIMGSFVVMSLAFMLLAWANQLSMAVFLVVVLGICEQSIGTLFFAILLDTLPEDQAGTGSGVMNACGHLGSISAMSVTGLLLDRYHTYQSVFLALCGVSFIGLAAVHLAGKNKVKA